MDDHDSRCNDRPTTRRGANVNAARVASDGTLVVGNLVGEITEYDLDLQPVGGFPGLRALVVLGGLRFSNDGKVLMASSLARTVAIYDVATRTRLGDPLPVEFTTTTGGLPSLRPDGMAFAVGNSDGIAIWDLDPEQPRCRSLPPRRTQTSPPPNGIPISRRSALTVRPAHSNG